LSAEDTTMARSNQIMNVRPQLERHFGFSQAVRSDPYIFISGTAAIDEQGAVKGGLSMAEQIDTVFTELWELLAQLGVKPEAVVKETIFTTDIDALAAAAAVRAKYFAGCSPPASSWIEVRRLFRPELLLEVELTVEAPR
jgi:enamine deaminase RidA (YjgF/YER057c/UK114 family)